MSIVEDNGTYILLCVQSLKMQTYVGHDERCLRIAQYLDFESTYVKVYSYICAHMLICREDWKNIYQTVNSCYLWVVGLQMSLTCLGTFCYQ